jgi:uncharacterized membrane protein YhdT
MSRHTSARLAWALCALSLALTALSLLLFILNLSYPNTHLYEPWLDNTLTAVFYPTVGAIVASRRPENPVGWLLCLYGLVISISYFCAEYAIYALLAEPNSLPAAEVLVWIVSWMLSIIVGLPALLYLLFPTGRLPSRRWRWVAWLIAALVLAGVITSAFSSGALMGVLGPIRNPLGIEGFTGVYKALLYFISPVALSAVVLSVFMRLRRAAGVERQQIKWFAYAAAASVMATSLAYLVPGVIDTPLWFERMGFALNIAFIPAIPIAIGIAILRYRLYDIDRIINRTLVYGALSATLVALYFGGIVMLQRVFVLEFPSIGSASWCKAGTDAPSCGEFSKLPERKEHAPCPHSHLTSSSPSGNSSKPSFPSAAPTIRSDATAHASPSGSSSRSWCRCWSSAAPTTGSPTHLARRARCVEKAG